jgi:hypothetical protein
MNRLNRAGLVLALVATLLGGCGGGGSAAPAAGPAAPAVVTVTGKFVDATVVGLSYKCNGATAVSGATNSIGEYTCPQGKPVAFYVGDILIGTVNAPMAVVTPLDLVGAGATPSHTTVTNIVRFLMSISSTDPTTGVLTITPAVTALAAGKTVDFTANTATALNALIALIKPGATVFTNVQATTHVTGSLGGLFAGNYSGTFTGGGTGTWSVSISPAGVVSGTATDNSGSAPVNGIIATTLSTGSTYGFVGTAGSAAWVGTLNISTRAFSGNWTQGQFSGTFSGAAR